MKQFVRKIDATPEKRSYWSIINDYDLNTAVCELIDNPLDIWRKKGGTLNVNIIADIIKQTMSIEDDSGGISIDDLHLVVRPGGSANTSDEATIGIFGVGSKRSVVAIAKSVSITSRKRQQTTYMVEYGDHWLSDGDWHVECYEVDDCSEGHTVIALSDLRNPLDESQVADLKQHLKETYSHFLDDQCFNLKLNGEKLTSSKLEDWAFPEGYSPTAINENFTSQDGKLLKLRIVGGLITQSAYETGEYGVYFFCNNRLIDKALKGPEVGFAKGHAGVTHHSHSASRIMVHLNGPAKWMPWNSSKSAIHFAHATYKQIQDHIIQMVTLYATLSKRLQPQWKEDVFPHVSGEIEEINVKDYGSVKCCPLPVIPKTKPHYASEMSSHNKAILLQKPWTQPIIDGVIAVHSIQTQKLKSKNQLALIMLDGLVEIGLKEFLIHEGKITDAQGNLESLFENRTAVEENVRKQTELSDKIWAQLTLLHSLRRKMVTQPFFVDVTDAQMDALRNAVQSAMKTLFGVRFVDRSKSLKNGY